MNVYVGNLNSPASHISVFVETIDITVVPILIYIVLRLNIPIMLSAGRGIHLRVCALQIVCQKTPELTTMEFGIVS